MFSLYLFIFIVFSKVEGCGVGKREGRIGGEGTDGEGKVKAGRGGRAEEECKNYIYYIYYIFSLNCLKFII